jgi:hypothetical protein
MPCGLPPLMKPTRPWASEKKIMESELVAGGYRTEGEGGKMNPGNLWRSTAGQLGAAASGMLKQACPGTQVPPAPPAKSACAPLRPPRPPRYALATAPRTGTAL